MGHQAQNGQVGNGNDGAWTPEGWTNASNRYVQEGQTGGCEQAAQLPQTATNLTATAIAEKPTS